jgi:hypothetical protein
LKNRRYIESKDIETRNAFQLTQTERVPEHGQNTFQAARVPDVQPEPVPEYIPTAIIYYYTIPYYGSIPMEYVPVRVPDVVAAHVPAERVPADQSIILPYYYITILPYPITIIPLYTNTYYGYMPSYTINYIVGDNSAYGLWSLDHPPVDYIPVSLRVLRTRLKNFVDDGYIKAGIREFLRRYSSAVIQDGRLRMWVDCNKFWEMDFEMYRALRNKSEWRLLKKIDRVLTQLLRE